MITPWISTFLQSASRPFKWWVVVAEWEQGVRVRLGKNTKLLLPGPHFRIPFLDRVFVQTTRTQVTNVESQTVSTLDGKTITYSVGIRFNVKDVKAMYNTFADLNGAMAQDAVAAVSDFVSSSNLADVSPAQINNYVMQHMTSYEFLGDFQVRILGFCVVRTYRLLSGGAYIPTHKGLDHPDDSGERT